MGFFKWLRSISLVKKICVGMATVLTVTGCTATVVAIADHTARKNNKKHVVVSTETSTFVEEPSSEEEQIEEAIHYSSMKISASSIEKDLDIFFLDENNKKIKGQPFSVKLVAVKDAEKLNSYVEKIENLNKEIKEAEDIVSGSTAPNAINNPAASSSAASSAAITAPSSSSTGLLVEDARYAAQKKLVDLGKQKVEAIDAYKDALKSIEGTVYTDDNQDGRITQKKLNPGDFSLCYVPTNDYDTAEYTQKATVKDKVEYKPVENIEEMKVAAEEAGDVAPEHEVVEESKAEDTVEYVESSRIEQPAEFKETEAKKPVASTGGTTVKEGVSLYDGAVLYSGTSEANTVSFDVKPSNGMSIYGTPESDVEGLTATLENGKLTLKADGISNDVTGHITLKITNDPTKKDDPSEASSSSAQDSSAASSSTPESSSTTESSSAKESSSESTSGSASSSSKQEETKESETKYDYKEVVIEVNIHGSNTQLKDSATNTKPLFLDENGTTPATVENYEVNATYYYEFKKAGETIYYGWQTINGLQYYFDKTGKKVVGPQVILGVKYKFGSDGALLTSGLGIDVSKWQGRIDWSEAKSAVSFAIIRAGFRGTSGGIAEDEYAATNIRGCNANGIRCGLYFYSRATTEAEAVEEASLAIAVAKKGSISLPIYFDMESDENRAAEDKDALVMAFCRTVQAAGYSAGLYASKNWINNYLNPSTYGGISIWVAQYADTCNYGGHYDMWQYTSKGSVPGINTNVDMNESHF